MVFFINLLGYTTKGHWRKKNTTENTHARDREVQVMAFVISHPTARSLELAARQTWAREGVVWFNTVDELDGTVVISAEPNSYENILERCLKVWAYVWRESTAADWYFRYSPDNYVLWARVREVMNKYDPNVPIIIGRVGQLNGTKYVSGGPGWIVSRAALSIWNIETNGTFACSKEQLGPEYYFAEDVLISLCLSNIGVHLVHEDGFHHVPYDHETVNVTPLQAVAGVPKQVNTLHWMKEKYILDMHLALESMARLTVVTSWHVLWSNSVIHRSTLPYTIGTWRQIGVKQVVIIIGSDKKMKGEGRRLKDLCRKADPHVRVIYLAENARQGRVNHLMNFAVLAYLTSKSQESIHNSKFIMSLSPGAQPDANIFKHPLTASHIRAWSSKEMFEFQRNSSQNTNASTMPDDSIHVLTASWLEWRHCLQFYESFIDTKSRVTDESGIEVISLSTPQITSNSTVDVSHDPISARYFFSNCKLVETGRLLEGISGPVSRESDMTYTTSRSSFLTV